MAEDEGGGPGLIETHQALKKRTKLLRIVFPLVIILIVVLNVFGLVRQVEELDTEALASSFESEAHKVWPRIEDDLALIAKHMEPVLAKEIQKQSEALAPRLESRLKSDVEKLKVRIERDFHTELEKSLDEIDGGCRFRNCLHETEPDCAVRAAAQAGEVHEDRYASYLAIVDSVRRGDG